MSLILRMFSMILAIAGIASLVASCYIAYTKHLVEFIFLGLLGLFIGILVSLVLLLMSECYH